MKVVVELFGAFRDHGGDSVELTLGDGANVADLRAALAAHAARHWPRCSPGLLRSSAFAGDAGVLRDREPLPGDGRMAVLPPVSGG